MKFLKKNFLLIIVIILMIILCIIKQTLIINLPILAYAGAVEDDQLMVVHAINILEGNWLGNYSYNTLVKNVFFSIFLALIKLIEISYTNAITLLYSIACIFFIVSIRKKVSSKIFILITFTMLLFNPIMYSEEIIQRVYRNSLIPSFALIIMGSYIGMFLCRNDNIIKNISFSITAAISFSCFYYTREDSVWMIPYVVFMSLSIVIALIVKFMKDKNYNKKTFSLLFLKFVLLVLPVMSTFLFGNYISNKNFEYYQTKIICTQENHSKLMNTLYSIKPNKEIPLVSNTKEKLERIAKVSPTFANIKPELDKLIPFFEDKKSGEVTNGLFGWPLITAIYSSGYNTPEKEKEIMDKISEELNLALDKGLLERQEIMPILGGELLDSEDYKKWIETFFEAIVFVGDYNNIKIANSCISPFYPGLDTNMNMFKEITGNRVLFEDNAVDINGDLLVELQDQEEYLKSIEKNFSVLNGIKKVYNNLAIPIEILGIISYITATIYVFINIFKNKYEMLEEWVIVSGIVGAIITLLIGVTYVEITQTKAVVYLYLVGVYPLIIAFSLISIYSVYKLISNKIKEMKEKKI